MARIPAHGLKAAAPQQGVVPDLGAMTAPGRALLELAEAGVAGMDEVNSFLAGQQEVVNRRALAEGRLKMREMLAGVQERMAADPDPSRWMDYLHESLESFGGELDEMQAAPVVKEALHSEYLEFAGNAKLRVSRDSFQRNLELTREAVRAEYDGLVEAGRYEEAAGLLEADGKEAGYAPEQIERMKAQLLARGRREEWEKRVMRDPAGVRAEIEEAGYDLAGLDAGDTLALYRRARSEQAVQARDEAREVVERIETRSITTRKELDDVLEAAEHLEDYQKEAIRRSWEDRQPLSPAERAALGDALEEAYQQYQAGELDEEAYRQEHAEIEAEIHALGPRPGAGALRSLAYRRDPNTLADPSAQAPPSARSDQGVGVKAATIAELARLRTSGADDAAAKEMQLYLRERLEGRMRDYVATHPEATAEKLGEQLDRWQIEETRKLIEGPDPSEEAEQMEQFLRENAPAGPPPGAGLGAPLLDLVKQLEGFTPSAQWDVRQWSVGYGTRGKKGEKISKEEAERRLRDELQSHRARVAAAAEKGGYQFAAHELDALTSFDFNCGKIEQLLLENGKRSRAQIANTMLLYLTKEEKYRKGVLRRRWRERDLFLHGGS